jgi:hypothetical protein
MKELAISLKFQVSHEYEVVYLDRPNAPKVVIGDFYGDPSCAVISPGETWCAIAGAGLIIYFLKEPFEPYQYDRLTDQWIEFGREKNDLWWVESLTALSDTQLVFTTDPNGDRPGTFNYDIVSGEVKKQ